MGARDLAIEMGKCSVLCYWFVSLAGHNEGNQNDRRTLHGRRVIRRRAVKKAAKGDGKLENAVNRPEASFQRFPPVSRFDRFISVR